MNDSFLKRYTNGEYRKVWLEIQNLDFPIADSVLKEDILAVAEEIMRRARYNIEIISKRLIKSDFVFTSFQEKNNNPRDLDIYPPWKNPSHEYLSQFLNFKNQISAYGEVPISILKFYEIVGEVNFIGYFPAWKENIHIPGLDPLFLYSLKDQLEYLEGCRREEAKFGLSDKNFFLTLFPDDLFKAGASGGGPIGVHLGKKPLVDDILDGYIVDIGFVDYLRICFRWGGFPQLQFLEEADVPQDETLQFIKNISGDLIPI